MSTYKQILYQIVFGTWNHEKTMIKEGRIELFKYIWGIMKKKKCHLFQINGIDDHLHIIMHLHPSISLAGLIKDIKLASSKHVKEKNLFPSFQGWQEGYGAFTYHIESKDNLIDYVKRQEEHHRKISFREEYIRLLKEHQIEFDEKYLM